MEEKIRLSLLLKIVNNMFERELNNKVAEMDLTCTQCNIVRFLDVHSNKDISPIDIEKEFCLKRPTVTGILKRLEEKEFIKVKQDSNDKRYKRIECTEKCKELQVEMHKNIDEMEEVLFQNISEKDKKELYRILELMFINLKK